MHTPQGILCHTPPTLLRSDVYPTSQAPCVKWKKPLNRNCSCCNSAAVSGIRSWVWSLPINISTDREAFYHKRNITLFFYNGTKECSMGAQLQDLWLIYFSLYCVQKTDPIWDVGQLSCSHCVKWCLLFQFFLRLRNFQLVCTQHALYQTRKTVLDHISIHQEDLKIRRTTAYFWRKSRCLEIWSNTVLRAWYIFETRTKEKTGE